jgi:hypothetical protein
VSNHRSHGGEILDIQLNTVRLPLFPETGQLSAAVYCSVGAVVGLCVRLGIDERVVGYPEVTTAVTLRLGINHFVISVLPVIRPEDGQ